MRELLGVLLDEQDREGSPRSKRYGSFQGGADRTTHLSTALALTALVNLGEGLAKEIGRLDEYRQAVQAAAAHLLRGRKRYRVRNPETFRGDPERPAGVRWEDGLFFSASFWELAQWRSRPYSVAMVMEALIKVRTGYQTHERTLRQSSRLRLVAPEGQDGWRLVEEPGQAP